MKVHHLEQEQFLPVPRERAWEFFSRPANLDLLTPPEMAFETIRQDAETIYPGQIIVHRVRILPGVKRRWVSEITALEHGRWFIDEQRAGPFKFWQHRHALDDTDGGTLVRDTLRYALPLSPLSEIAHPWLVRPMLEKLFRFRRGRLAEIFTSPARAASPADAREPRR